MKRFLRWKTTVASSFEHVLYHLENHDAVIATAIREVREAAAGAQVKLNRLRRDGERLRSRIGELHQAAATWAERAVQVHTSDPAKAMECVRRRQQTRSEAQHLETELKAHQEIERQLQRDLAAMENRIAELGRRRNAFSAREYRAKAVHAVEACNPTAVGDSIDEVFDRWEVKLASTEPMLSTPVDSLEAEFAAEEDRATLEAELAELLRNSSRADS